MIDDMDKAIIDLLQSKFPVTKRPYLELSRQLNMTEADLMSRIALLKENGYIRRIGGIFDSRKLGYTGTLCAMKVPMDRIGEVSEIVNSYSGITHNYIRDHSFNMWFTMLAPSVQKVEENILEIRMRTGISELLVLPAVTVFKINASFKMKEV